MITVLDEVLSQIPPEDEEDLNQDRDSSGLTRPGRLSIEVATQVPRWQRGFLREHLRGLGVEESHFRNVMGVLDNNDQLWVGVAPAPSAWHGLPDDVANWIHENQK